MPKAALSDAISASIASYSCSDTTAPAMLGLLVGLGVGLADGWGSVGLVDGWGNVGDAVMAEVGVAVGCIFIEWKTKQMST